MDERLPQNARRPRENEPAGRSFEERPSGDPAAFVTKTLGSRSVTKVSGNDELE
jgi:hypothetical protein